MLMDMRSMTLHGPRVVAVAVAVEGIVWAPQALAGSDLQRTVVGVVDWAARSSLRIKDGASLAVDAGL